MKASLDDELALLLAVGSDTVGNVSVVSHGQMPSPTPATTPAANLIFPAPLPLLAMRFPSGRKAN